jgi:hypothetical protein
MNAPEFLCVPEHVARNPIARAIARQQIAKATAEYSTRLHMLEDGEECASDLDATARVLGVALAILEARKTTDDTLTAGLAALADMARMGCRWESMFAGRIDAALQQANDVFQQATATETRLAWVRVVAA